MARRWLGRFWGRHPIPETQRGEAEQTLERVRAQHDEVTRISEALNTRRDSNNFREAMEYAFRGKT